MSMHKLAIAAGLLVAALLVGLTPRSSGQFRDPSRGDVRGVVKSIKDKQITLSIGEGRDAAATERSWPLSEDVEVAIGTSRGGIFKKANTADLLPGTHVGLTLSADQKTVEAIVAESPTERGVLQAVDPVKKTITVKQQTFRDRNAIGAEKVYTVAADAEIAMDDGRGRRYSIREAQLADLSVGAEVTLRLGLDKKEAQSIVAEGATETGIVKSIDADKRTLTLTRSSRGDNADERTLSIAKDATILVDDGRGRRLSLKEVKLADVPVGSLVAARLAADQEMVMLLKAGGPMLTGLLKAVDADKLTITISIPKGRDDAEELTRNVAKDARISAEGGEVKLSSLKPGDDVFVNLRLSLDQKTVQSIQAGRRGSR